MLDWTRLNFLQDHGDFVDFIRQISAEPKLVARYRASEIRRLLRLEG
jgi:hypothetical protein